MFAPVFFWELDHVSRRRWFANVRRIYAGIVLFFFLWYVLDTTVFGAGYSPWHQYQRFRWLHPENTQFLMAIHAFAVFLLTPILAITGVTQARNRQVLDLLLTSRQRPFEIVGSYWLAAVVKIILITLPGVPVLFWMGSIWGTPWWVVAVRLVCCWLMALPIAAWCVMVTLRMRQIVPALVLGYAAFGLWPSMFLFFTDAQLASLAYARYDATFWQRFFLFIAVPTTICLLIATMRLRAWVEGVRQPAVTARDHLARPPVAEDPVYWKQYYFHDFSVIGFLGRLPSWARVALFVIVSCAACSSPPGVADLTPQFEMVVMLIAFPVGALTLAASTASVEREAGTWDPLRVTLIGADEYFTQTLDAVLVRMKTYWLATLPAVAILSGKRDEIGLLAPVVWWAAGSLMRPAAVIGLCSSVKAHSASQSMLRALVMFLPIVGGIGFAMLVFLVICFESADRYAGFAVAVVLHGQRGVALLTLLHLFCTWLLLRRLFAWFSTRQLRAAVAFLSESECFQAAPRS